LVRLVDQYGERAVNSVQRRRDLVSIVSGRQCDAKIAHGQTIQHTDYVIAQMPSEVIHRCREAPYLIAAFHGQAL
jgi:tyrosine-protein phosphatase YwqE